MSLFTDRRAREFKNNTVVVINVACWFFEVAVSGYAVTLTKVIFLVEKYTLHILREKKKSPVPERIHP